MVHLQNGDAQLALNAAEQACQSDDKNHLPRLALTAVFLTQGEMDAAKFAWRDTLRTKADLTQHEIDCFVGKKFGAGIKLLSATVETGN